MCLLAGPHAGHRAAWATPLPQWRGDSTQVVQARQAQSTRQVQQTGLRAPGHLRTEPLRQKVGKKSPFCTDQAAQCLHVSTGLLSLGHQGNYLVTHRAHHHPTAPCLPEIQDKTQTLRQNYQAQENQQEDIRMSLILLFTNQ